MQGLQEHAKEHTYLTDKLESVSQRAARAESVARERGLRLQEVAMSELEAARRTRELESRLAVTATERLAATGGKALFMYIYIYIYLYIYRTSELESRLAVTATERLFAAGGIA